MRILVVVNPEVVLEEYFISHLIKAWQSQGHNISLHKGYLDPLPSADVVFLHVDLTTVPDEYLEAVAGYPHVVNKAVTKIGKDEISQYLVCLDDDYDGPVIVKTTRNYFGYRELSYGSHAEEEDDGSLGKAICLRNYPIFRSKARVPFEVWSNPNLVVERFLPEISPDGFYTLRVWSFLGDKESLTVAYSRQPVIKSGNYFGKTRLDTGEVPKQLRAWRNEMGFDYGKFDFTLHKGEPILFDTNKTIGASPQLAMENGFTERADAFSRGLFTIIGGD